MLKKYNINFYRAVDGKFIDVKDIVSSYLNLWKTINDIDNFLRDINLCLNGNIANAIDTNYSNSLVNVYGEITSDQLIISDKTGIHTKTVPLVEFKELLISWKEYLQS